MDTTFDAVDRRAGRAAAAAPSQATDPAPPLPGPNCLQVGMGQLKIGARTEQLHAVLGSCVGIAFIWKKGGCCGLAHCLLPEPPHASLSRAPIGPPAARYVSEAVPSLLRMMGAREADYADIEVVLAGGANMLSGRASRLQVGQQNVAAAQKYLQQLGLNVRYCRLGGKQGRTMLIDCAQLSFVVAEISHPPAPAYPH